METLIKADIFFFISSVATIVLTILFSILLFYVIRAGRNLYLLSESLKGSFEESKEFIADLKERLEDNMIFRIFFPPVRRKRRATTKSDSSKDTN